MARKRFDSSRIELVRPNLWRWPARAGLALWACWVALLFFHLEAGAPTGAVVAWSGAAATVVGVLSFRFLRKDRRRRRGRLVADEKRGVVFRNRTIVERGDIFAAHLLGGRRSQVQILRFTHPAPLEIRVESEEAGLRLIHCLGLTMAEGTAQYHLLYRWTYAGGPMVLTVLLIFTLLVCSAAVFRWGFVVAPILLIAPFAVRRLRKRVIIGSDGMLLEGVLRRRFIEYRTIQGVAVFSNLSLGESAWAGVDVELRPDETLRMLTARRGAAPTKLPPEPISVALAERLDGLVDTLRDAEPVAGEAKQVVRDGRSDAEWFDHLRRLASGSAADYRSAPVHADDLWRLVENPGAEPSMRVGAAVALASSDAHRELRRLRATAATVVAPRLRKSLQRVAWARNERSLRRALAGIEDETQPGVE